MNTMTNGKARKSLAEQIDKLDHMLDGLGDALNDSMMQAVKNAVGLAVKEAVAAVLRELLASPELLAQVQAQDPWAELTTSSRKSTAKKPGLVQRMKQASRWIGRKLIMATRTCGTLLHTLATVCSARWQGLCSGVKLRMQQLREATLTRLSRSYRLLVNYGQIAWHVRRIALPVTVSLVIGTAAGVAAWSLGPWASSLASGIGGFTTALAVQGGMWLRQTMGGSPGPSQVA